jgi:hypothetical protein
VFYRSALPAGCLHDIKSHGFECKPQQLQLTATATSSAPASSHHQHGHHCKDNAAAALEADSAAAQGLSWQLDQAVLHIMTDPETSSAGSSRCDSSSSSSSSSRDAEDDIADTKTTSRSTAAAAAAAVSAAHANTQEAGRMPSLSVSPLCPVVSLESYWGQACLKLLLHIEVIWHFSCIVHDPQILCTRCNIQRHTGTVSGKLHGLLSQLSVTSAKLALATRPKTAQTHGEHKLLPWQLHAAAHLHVCGYFEIARPFCLAARAL